MHLAMRALIVFCWLVFSILHVVCSSLCTFVLKALHCLQDLDLRKPGVWKPTRQAEFEVTTEEVLRKADFRVS